MIDFDFEYIQNVIGYRYNRPQNLITAFTHSSLANERGEKSYERFEFLGDSILNLVIACYLCRRFRDEDEGFLTKTRARIVSTKSLGEVIQKLELIKYMRTSGGAIENEVMKSSSVMADLFEAIVGSIMEDSGGLEECERFILDKLASYLNATYTADNITDFKSRLLEYASHKKLEVKFEISEINDDRRPLFKAVALIAGRALGSGEGNSKKKAEQLASAAALKALDKD